MIAQFPGKCAKCREPITVGVDIYDKKAKRTWHRRCEPQIPFDRDKAERLAAELGYIGLGDFTAGVFRDWQMLVVSGADRDRPAPAERSNNDSREQQGALFGMSET